MRYFTICNTEQSISPYKWGGRTNYSNLRSRERPGSATKAILLFGTDNPDEKLTELDVYAIAQDTFIQKRFGVYFVELDATANQITVANDFNDVILPDQADAGDYIIIFSHGEALKIDLRERFNDCREMIKRALGCTACPMKGRTCMKEAANEQLKLEHLDVVTFSASAFQEELTHMQDSVAGFTYVSPVMTRPTDLNNKEYFMPALRRPEEHAFECVGEWIERRQDQAKKGARSRKFIRENCNRCVYQSECKRYSSCAGRYPPQDLYVKHILQRWEPIINDKERNPFEPWQFWAIARAGGDDGLKRYRRMTVLLEGLVYSGAFRAGIHRAKTSLYRVEKTADWDLLVDLFGLPKTEADVDWRSRKPEDERSIALYLESLEQRVGYTHHGNEKNIIWRRLHSNGMEYNVAVCGERYHGRPWGIQNFATFYKCFRAKPRAPQGNEQLELEITG